MADCDRPAYSCTGLRFLRGPGRADRRAGAGHRGTQSRRAGAGGRGPRDAPPAGRNSGNSSMAPSADDLPGRTPPKEKPRRPGGKRKPGKQPGAPGAHLAWSDDPDQTMPHFPQGTCECGADLAAAADLGVAASHQVIDIPVETAQVIQHDLHEAACTCGRVHRASAPAGTGTPGTVTYGLALQALCAYLI